MSTTSTSSGVSTSAPKASKFGSKSGFVIPKNKLSGSLVPIFRGGKKPGGNDANKEESLNQVHRKTKWGPDLTQDTAVRRGRASAYQTRVDQITEQLKLGTEQLVGDQASQIADEHADNQISDLELERREAIGEILKLNPSYKAPPDYKPLQKEATVHIPVKDYPGFNFVILIFGPNGETLKRLEKETGAKIQLDGTKANTGEKVEISPSDGNEIQVAYEELIVHLSAESFDKVDAAVSLVDMLVTSVSGNLASGNKADFGQSQEASTTLAQPIVGPIQAPQHGQFQFQNTWFQAGVPQAPIRPSNFSQNHSAPLFNNPQHVQSTSLNPSTMSSMFGPQPVPGSAFNSVLQNPSPAPISPEPSIQVLPNTYLPRNSQPSSAQTSILTSHPFPGNQLQPAGLSPVSRPQPVSTVLVGPQSNGPVNLSGSSTGWSGFPLGVPPSLGLNMGQGSSMVAQPGFPSNMPSSNVSAGSGVSPIAFGARPTNLQPNFPLNHPMVAPISSSWPPPAPQVTPSSAPRPIQSSPMMPASQPIFHSGATTNFNSVRPPPATTALRPPHSGPGDFTFHPHQSQNPVSQTVPRLSSQHIAQNIPLPSSAMPQPPSFRMSMPNSTPQPGMHTFPRPQLGSQMAQAQVHMSIAPFSGQQMGVSVPPRSSFSNSSSGIPPAPIPQMGFRNFSPVPQLSTSAGPFPSRPGGTLQLQQNYPATTAPPRGNFMSANYQFNRNPTFAAPGRPTSIAGGQQIYDPFSPTSVPIATQRQADNLTVARKQEKDPEYEDLMASVGVK